MCVCARAKKTFHHTLILVGLFLLPPLELERTERLGSRPWCGQQAHCLGTGLPPLDEFDQTERVGSRPWCGQQARCPRTGVFRPWAAVEAMSVAPCCGKRKPPQIALVNCFLDLPPLDEFDQTEWMGSCPWCGQQARCPRMGVFWPWAVVEAMSVAPCCGSDNPLKSPW